MRTLLPVRSTFVSHGFRFSMLRDLLRATEVSSRNVEHSFASTERHTFCNWHRGDCLNPPTAAWHGGDVITVGRRTRRGPHNGGATDMDDRRACESVVIRHATAVHPSISVIRLKFSGRFRPLNKADCSFKAGPMRRTDDGHRATDARNRGVTDYRGRTCAASTLLPHVHCAFVACPSRDHGSGWH